MKAAFLVLSVTLMGVIAQAKTTTYQGVGTSRQQCEDSGGVFANDTVCDKISLNNKACKITLNMDGRRINKVTVDIPEIKAKKESFFATLSGSAKGPWMYDSNKTVYSIKLNKTSSVELKLTSDSDVLLAANVYTDHKSAGAKVAYKQYTCGKLRAVR